MKIEDARRQVLPALKALCELPDFKKENIKLALECIMTSYIDLDFLKDDQQVEEISIKDIIVEELKYYLDELNKI